MSHDASATWSGFNYQGKVALYHTLTLIKQKLGERLDFDFSGYELILENHEDFDIKGPDGFESFHQVKAINETAFSTFENALFAMLLQLDMGEFSSVTGYLHTWRPLNWNGGDSFEVKLKGVIYKVIENHQDDPTNSYIQKTFSDELVAEKKIKILRQARDEDGRLSNENEVFRILNTMYGATDALRVTGRVKQYDYGDGLACDIASIDIKVKTAIAELHSILSIDSAATAIEKIFCVLLSLLDENIILKHLNLNSGNETPILFSGIIDVITRGSVRDSDEAYLAARFKLNFIRLFDEFLDDEDLCPAEISESYFNGDSNLNTAMNVLLNLPAKDLLHHYKILSPHIALDAESTLDNAISINRDDLRQYLFPIFADMCRTKFSHDDARKLILYKSSGKSYLPTTIGAGTKKRLVIDIMNNGQAISLLFEVSAMVTGCENAVEINHFGEEYSRLSSVSLEQYYVDEAVESREKISQISRDIRLIKKSTAIREMDDA
ncbi:ABC-three component system protein [Thalassolituus pacificus]|uniref:DUF4297 domain-containing protein n=1 Tax=Thalassolituus pacificus TaxID=2975440 RepID=A0A9X2WFZ6_9GAMM|nr:ABC-three component system protein [Thalassolituus pacificus]MCT7359579.1 DUF4297 domain-containing protein [Thalassolituus pacificus]